MAALLHRLCVVRRSISEASFGGVDAEKRSLEWLRNASNAGNAKAKRMLGRLFLSGNAFFTLEQSETLLRDSAASEPLSHFPLALLLHRRSQFADAFRHFQIAADGGDSTARGRLALMLLQGQGCQRDEKAALTLLKSAAENGDIEAQHRFVGCLLKSDAKEDGKTAQHWADKATSQADFAAGGRALLAAVSAALFGTSLDRFADSVVEASALSSITTTDAELHVFCGKLMAAGSEQKRSDTTSQNVAIYPVHPRDLIAALQSHLLLLALPPHANLQPTQLCGDFLFEHSAATDRKLVQPPLNLVVSTGHNGPVLQYLSTTPLTPLLFYSLAIGLAKAIHFLHANNLLHCDVSARNVFVGKEAVLGCVGSLCHINAFKQPFFSASSRRITPEDLRGEYLSGLSDVFCFGLTLVEILTAAQPQIQQPAQSPQTQLPAPLSSQTAGFAFDTCDPAQLPQLWQSTREALPKLPLLSSNVGLRDLIARCLADEASRRPSAVQLFQELSQLSGRGIVGMLLFWCCGC